MDQIPRISEVVYVRMSQIVGTSTQVSIRRDVQDIAHLIKTPIYKPRRICEVRSGSFGEGFRLKTSDVDHMVWPSDHHVLCDLNQADHYNTGRCTLILMECANDRPGFVMLQLLTPSNNVDVQLSCLEMDDRTYIRSAHFRDCTVHKLKIHSTYHGPSATGNIGNEEFDLVHCFKCEFWPAIANLFTMRCQCRNWPSSHVLRDIINSGCHVVPKGLKRSAQEHLEWMISFSIAEQKLVFSMNHAQFLCYGLLKLFVQEVLTEVDTDGDPLLCSYFMKTILFWVIQNNAFTEWNPSSLLNGFWLCFKFLLSCVYHGCLPIFFIPENNMFNTKIHGHPQQVLYEHLYEMYNIGIACLLHCPSVRDYFMQAICNRQYVVSTVESDIVSQAEIDAGIVFEICHAENIGNSCQNLRDCFCVYTMLGDLDVTALNISQRVVVRKFTSALLRHTSFLLHGTCISNHLTNKQSLRIAHVCLHILKVSTELGCISDIIYLCLFLYKIGNIEKAMLYLDMVRRNLAQPHVLYNGRFNQRSYMEAVGGRSLSEKLRRAVVDNISIDSDRMLIRELELEFRMTSIKHLMIPPSAFTLMLLILCFRGNSHKQHGILFELYILLHHGDGRYIPEELRDISWQILGICQQICGNHQGALLSYQESLRQIAVHEIQEATQIRIQNALSKI